MPLSCHRPLCVCVRPLVLSPHHALPAQVTFVPSPLPPPPSPHFLLGHTGSSFSGSSLHPTFFLKLLHFSASHHCRASQKSCLSLVFISPPKICLSFLLIAQYDGPSSVLTLFGSGTAANRVENPLLFYPGAPVSSHSISNPYILPLYSTCEYLIVSGIGPRSPLSSTLHFWASSPFPCF